MPVRILVVDDEPDLESLIRQRFRKSIRSQEYEFQFAGNGEQALDALSQDEGIDIVLTDINMPKMDGLVLLERIGELDRLIKSVVVSAYGDMENIRTAMNRGAFDFLTKPIDFNDLEITIGKTIRELEKLKQGLRARDDLFLVQKELDVAARIQQTLLPKDFPPFPDRPELDLFGLMTAARQIGGDFFDFFFVGPSKLGFVIGDVAGKGIPAAILMAVTKTLIKASALRGGSPDECISHVNRVLCAESDPEVFVTAIYGVLDLETGEVAYTNAGHNLPYLLRPSAPPEAMENQGCVVLGILPDYSYRTSGITLQPGETLLLYTDGVTEAMNTERQLFGEERLLNALAASDSSDLANLCHGVELAIATFADGQAQHDDVTMLAIRFNGATAQ